MRCVLALLLLAGSGCSLITVHADPFPPLEVRAAPPAPAPPPKPPERVVVTASTIAIADKVQFATGSADILEISWPLLDDVAKVLLDNPQIELVAIVGHTDSTGAAAANRALSQARAESVMKYLVGKGVAAPRLSAKGFGSDKPIDDNSTEAGRDRNRRVEFDIIRQGPKKVVQP